MIPVVPALVVIILAFFAGIAWHRFVLTKPAARQAVGLDPVVSSAVSTERPIIVNVPADWKPAIPPMPENEMSGARAHLWYAVFEKTLDAAYQDADDAREAADAAVNKAFGNL